MATTVDYRRADQLLPDDARRRQGAFFTPALWVDEAHKYVSEVLGSNWKDECLVWDNSAGTGNLTRDYSFGDLILTTAEEPDVRVIEEQGYNAGALVQQYDFLNPGVDSPFFEVASTNVLSDAIVLKLREASAKGKRLVFLMNPPYGTANNAGTEEGDHKAGIALTAVNADMKKAKLGAPSQQLYAQFLFQSARLARDFGFTDYTVAVFSGLTFMTSGSYKPFRDWWYGRHEFKSGFLFQASHFADVSGRWGISFTVWNGHGVTDPKGDLPLDLKDVADFKVVTTGVKTVYNSDGREASKWVREPLGKLKGVDAPQMSSGLKLKTDGKKGHIGAVSFLVNNSNALYDSGTLSAFASAPMSASGLSVLPSNWRRAIALYAARKLVLGNWVNDKDEYLVPDASLTPYAQWVEASKWVREPLNRVKGVDAPQMSSGLTVKESSGCRGVLNRGSLLYMTNVANCLYKSGTDVFWTSSCSSMANGLSVLPSNWRRAIALYAARKLVLGNWVNDKDEYLVPDASLTPYAQWVNDCHVYALLHPSNNCTSMRGVQYKDGPPNGSKTWTIHNHFFWGKHADTLKLLDTPATHALYRDCKAHPSKDVFGNAVESTPDPYMAHVLEGMPLSPDALAVLALLDNLWVKSLPLREGYAAGKPELHLMAWDAGVYQLKHIWRDLFPTEWAELQEAYKALGARLQPGVYEFGFLKR